MSCHAPYGAYKDSGVKWLGQVPEHWMVSRLRHSTDGSLSYGANEAAESDDPRHPRFIRITDLNEDGTLRDDTFKSLPLEVARPYLLKDGDVLLARSGATVGKSFIYRMDMGAACYAGYLIRARLLESKMLPKFFWYCTQSSYYWDFIGGSSIQATIQNVSGEKYSNLWLAIPPIIEQRCIVSNLDHEIARIDLLIEKKKRLAELLHEKRQALTTYAVTKGLAPDVKMKDSGVEWLGEVPEHWSVKPLKLLVKDGSTISYGIVQPGEPQDQGVPFVQTTNMSSGDFEIESLQKTTPEIAASFPRSCLNGGEVILGIRASIGAAFVVPEHLAGVNLSRGVARIDCSSELSSRFLVWYLRSMAVDAYWQLAKQGSTFNEVSIATVKELLIPVPPREEQADIEGVLGCVTARLDSILNTTERSIDLLKERRSALITAAVTGQIDMRRVV